MENKDRKLIQSVADCLKIIDKAVWANYLIRKIKNLDNVIIDDLRFQNEAIKLKKLGFIIIHLKVDKDTQLKRLKQKYSNFKNHINNLSHNSETEHNLIDADLYIESNDNTEFYTINYLESL